MKYLTIATSTSRWVAPERPLRACLAIASMNMVSSHSPIPRCSTMRLPLRYIHCPPADNTFTGVDDLDNACGPHSDCINRLTQVECLPDDCRCRTHCQN